MSSSEEDNSARFISSASEHQDEEVAVMPSTEETIASTLKTETPSTGAMTFTSSLSDTTLFHSFGFESFKRNNIHLVDDFTVIIAVGNTLQFLDIMSREYRWIEMKGRHGIGSITVHPNRKYIAIGERADMPNVYIHEYPSFDIYKTLTRGTHKFYSCMSFNKNGTLLATVGGAPDFMLTVWNWEEEKVILRYRAFGQDVFNVTFSPTDDGQLTTSGAGHIKFWKMARTFTGLKLQGQIGKFGKIDISDIYGYAELPDGKVLSGSEKGDLLLWEEQLIKCIFRRKDAPAHDGAVGVVVLKENEFITAGADGAMRFWDFDAIDTAEPSDTDSVIELDPVHEIHLGEEVNVVSLIESDKHWIIQDGTGAFWRLNKDRDDRVESRAAQEKLMALEGYTTDRLLDYHSGSITAIDTAPNDHVCVTGGTDGTVRLYDYRNKRKCLYKSKFCAGVTTIKWNPPQVDQDGITITVGFHDGVVRVLRRCEEEFELVRVTKPHRAAVTDFAYSSDGLLLATTGADNTLFFLQVGQDESEFNPVGFIRLSSRANSLFWTADDQRLVISLEQGIVVQMTRPVPNEIDTSTTYEFAWIFTPYLFHKMLRPPPKPEKKKKKSHTENQEENTEEILEEGEEGDVDGGEEDDDEAGESDNEEDSETNAEKERKEKERNEHASRPVTTAFYTPQNTMIAVMRRPQGVFEYSGNWWEDEELHTTPEYPDRLIGEHNAVCCTIRYSRSANYMILGYDDGIVELFDLTSSDDKSLYKMTRALHDCTNGRINGAVTSFDDAFLLTVSEDGCFFVQRIDERPVNETPNPPHVPIRTTEIQDIVTTDHWSIEESRVKTEQMRLNLATESRKEQRRRRIAHLKTELNKLIEKNAAKPLGMQLSREELQVDAKVKSWMEERLQYKLNEAEKQLEYDSRIMDMRLEKMKDHFIDCMDVERIVLLAFKSNMQVSSFRTERLTDDLKREIDKIHNIIDLEKMRKQSDLEEALADEDINSDNMSEHASDETTMTIAPDSGRDQPSDTNGPGKFKRSEIAAQKYEEIQRLKGVRQSLRDKLMGRRPPTPPKKGEDMTTDDPEFAAEIEFAKNNMGDFKLKTSSNYVVLEGQRMTEEKKRRQIVLMQDSVHTLRMMFNNRLLAMRGLKMRLVSKFNKNLEEIAAINKKLGIEQLDSPFQLQDVEYPEKREHITSDDVENYARSKAREDRKRQRMEAAKASGVAFVDDDDDDKSDTATSPAVEGTVDDRKQSRMSSASSTSIQSTESRRARRGRRDSSRASEIIVSQMEHAEREMERQRLVYEKNKIVRKMNMQIESFDNAISDLRHERLALEIDLKQADLKMLLLYKEHQLLKDYENRDRSLFKELSQKKQDKQEILQQIAACHDTLLEKREQVEHLMHHDQIITEFTRLVPSDHPAYEDLKTIFRKSRGHINKDIDEEAASEEDDIDNDSSDDDESNDDSDDNYSSSDEESDFEEEMEDMPDGCTEELFRQVLLLRKRKIEQEKLLDSISRSIDQVRKDREALLKREKIVDAALRQIEDKIEKVQQEKQQKLNDLHTVILLKFDQIYALYEDKIPNDLSDCVLFTNAGLRKLEERNKELMSEVRHFKRSVAQERKVLLQNHREIAEQQQVVDQWKKNVEDVQLLKFGRVVNLDELEDASVDTIAENLKMELAQHESHLDQTMQQYDQHIMESKQRVADVTRENTALLQHLARLRERQQQIEDDLDRAQTTMVKRIEKNMSDKENEDNKRLLRERVITQAREIENARTQIFALRSKSIY